MPSRLTKPALQIAKALLLLAITSLPAVAARNVLRLNHQAVQQFQTAQKLRDALNGKPAAERTRSEYQRVTDAFRRVYYTGPTSNKADDAVTAVAELLAEAGRAFEEAKLLKAAVGQYEFLRREYPGSKSRVEALFTIGQIYKEDLRDVPSAKATFEDFLKRYPRARLADEARIALKELDNPQKLNAKRDRRSETAKKAAKQESASEIKPTKLDATEPADQKAETQVEPKPEKSRLPLVTGVRHWSTPDYTRVAIDLETEIKYEAGRIAHPDRIFFDLHDTKLASTLFGKSFDVEDGFLRRIRIAQFQKGLTRVVLEVNDVSNYSAFLLPNPYRLIIDIHGKRVAKAQTSSAKKETGGITQNAEKQTDKTAADTVQAKKTETPAEADKPKSQATESASKASAAKDAKDIAAEATKQEQQAAKRISEVERTLAKVEPPAKAEDSTINIAKNIEPELKATDKPTTRPTFESVAPPEKRPSKSSRTRGSRAELQMHEARPTSAGERSLIRALGLKIGRIVVDAGHGGHDTGTIGPNGFQEKDLVLDVALRLGKLLDSKLGAEVVYTRDDDTFIPLETRTAIANQNQADLFISIHANSSRNSEARGIETYYLNFTSSAEALEVAARENSVSEKSIHELQDLVKKITLKDKIDESREFAADVQRALWTGLSTKNAGLRNRGVKKAPFIVLIGANMPSILAEISFLSNPGDERKLQTPEYRQKIAEHLYRGIQRYVSGLSGIKVASTRTETKPATRSGAAN